MNTIGKRYGILAVCSALLIALDQWAKSMAYSTLRVNGPLVLIKGVFELLYSENRGAAFGILQGKQWFFFLVAAAVVIAVLAFVAKLPSGTQVSVVSENTGADGKKWSKISFTYNGNSATGYIRSDLLN